MALMLLCSSSSFLQLLFGGALRLPWCAGRRTFGFAGRSGVGCRPRQRGARRRHPRRRLATRGGQVPSARARSRCPERNRMRSSCSVTSVARSRARSTPSAELHESFRSPRGGATPRCCGSTATACSGRPTTATTWCRRPWYARCPRRARRAVGGLVTGRIPLHSPPAAAGSAFADAVRLRGDVPLPEAAAAPGTSSRFFRPTDGMSFTGRDTIVDDDARTDHRSASGSERRRHRYSLKWSASSRRRGGYA